MDVVDYLLEQRRYSYEILKKNGIKQEIMTGYCPQCQQTQQEIEHQQQFIDPTVPEKIPDLKPTPPVEEQHTYYENESEIESESTQEDTQQTQNQITPLFL